MSKEKIEEVKKINQGLEEEIKKTNEGNKDGDILKSTVKDASLTPLQCRNTLIGHMGKVWTVSWSEDNRRFLSSSQDGKLIIWNALTTFKIAAIPLKNLWVMCAALSPKGNWCASGGLDNNCCVYSCTPKEGEMISSEPAFNLEGHSGYISAVKFIDDTTLLTSSGDQTCIQWDISQGKIVSTFKGEHTADIINLGVSPDKSLFVTGGVDQTTKIWDIKSGKVTHTLRGHTKDINSCQFFPNGLSVLTGSEDGSCKLFDIRSNNELLTYKREKSDPCSSVSFSKSGRFFFAGYGDNTICAWDTLKGKKVQEIKGHQQKVSYVSVAPDGSAILSASWDKTIKVWA